MSFKKGDKVICIPGFNNKDLLINPFYGGAGYEEGKIFIVMNTYYDVVWDDISGYGIYTKAIALYTDRRTRIEKLNL